MLVANEIDLKKHPNITWGQISRECLVQKSCVATNWYNCGAQKQMLHMCDHHKMVAVSFMQQVFPEPGAHDQALTGSQRSKSMGSFLEGFPILYAKFSSLILKVASNAYWLYSVWNSGVRSPASVTLQTWTWAIIPCIHKNLFLSLSNPKQMLIKNKWGQRVGKLPLAFQLMPRILGKPHSISNNWRTVFDLGVFPVKADNWSSLHEKWSLVKEWVTDLWPLTLAMG